MKKMDKDMDYDDKGKKGKGKSKDKPAKGNNPFKNALKSVKK